MKKSTIALYCFGLCLSLSFAFPDASQAFIFWRNDTEFKFRRNGSNVEKCFYQWVGQEIECPPNIWVTPEPRCPNMVWLHNARINDKEKLLFTVNFGKVEPSPSCKKMLKLLGKTN